MMAFFKINYISETTMHFKFVGAESRPDTN
jgi:hypothetical protein